ncbi:hypothetical protein H4R18_001869 [Coemansia javaensis]|uniref:Uncharacterized protein n=1 Tax=Coemansia javaensis TaxID=2761396 RepID=A0A9W8LIJ1_9FUNG|nr:hypothetical protein H4R18_001869 [Coemansia javaensis]
MRLALATLALAAAAAAAACPAYDVLLARAADDVAPQNAAEMIVAFTPDTPRAVLDAYRVALACRGAKLRPPMYEIKMLAGRIPTEYKAALESSRYVAAVDYDAVVSAM